MAEILALRPQLGRPTKTETGVDEGEVKKEEKEDGEAEVEVDFDALLEDGEDGWFEGLDV